MLVTPSLSAMLSTIHLSFLYRHRTETENPVQWSQRNHLLRQLSRLETLNLSYKRRVISSDGHDTLPSERVPTMEALKLECISTDMSIWPASLEFFYVKCEFTDRAFPFFYTTITTRSHSSSLTII
jgi:hypothetical protein